MTSTCCNELAKELGVKLKIENLDFNGLIPGLQAQKFDMVSVGLSNTPERAKVGELQPGVRPVRADPRRAGEQGRLDHEHRRAEHSPSKTITALQGSTAQMLAQKLFPKAKVDALPDQNAAFLAGRDRPR